jgi:hypothetical protein
MRTARQSFWFQPPAGVVPIPGRDRFLKESRQGRLETVVKLTILCTLPPFLLAGMQKAG